MKKKWEINERGWKFFEFEVKWLGINLIGKLRRGDGGNEFKFKGTLGN